MCFYTLLSGEKFVPKQADKRKKQKLKKVEEKMLGWGIFLVLSRSLSDFTIDMVASILNFMAANKMIK